MLNVVKCLTVEPYVDSMTLGDNFNVYNLVNVTKNDKHAPGYLPQLMCGFGLGHCALLL